MQPRGTPRGATTFAHPVTDNRCLGAVARLVADILVGEALGLERAVGSHMIASKAVEALADHVRWHQSTRCRGTPPTPLAVHLPEAILVRLDRHARQVDDNRWQSHARLTPPTWTWTMAPAPMLQPRQQNGLNIVQTMEARRSRQAMPLSR